MYLHPESNRIPNDLTFDISNMTFNIEISSIMVKICLEKVKKKKKVKPVIHTFCA